MAYGTPDAEYVIHIELVRDLLSRQHPDFADAAIQLADAGWDNVTYRLGDKYAVRLPRREVAVALAEHEHAWLPILADRLPIPIPSPVRIGRRSDAYPWPWSIVPWLPGDTADVAPPAAHQSRALADFLRALHRPAPPNAPKNPLRGVPLGNRAKIVEDRLIRLRNVSGAIKPELTRVWKDALAAPQARETCWLHGDLHAKNVIVSNGTITGIIDWGDITAGDAATDLATVWMLFDDSKVRTACLEHYQADTDLLARARGWAVLFGAALLEIGLADHSRLAAIGAATLRRVGEEARLG